MKAEVTRCDRCSDIVDDEELVTTVLVGQGLAPDSLADPTTRKELCPKCAARVEKALARIAT